MKKLIFITLYTFLLAFNIYSVPVTWDDESGDGLWNNPMNWDTDTVPAGGDDVTIGGYTVSLDVDTANLSSLTIALGGVLNTNNFGLTINNAATGLNCSGTFNGGSGNHTISGGLTATGTFDAGSGAVSIAGDFNVTGTFVPGTAVMDFTNNGTIYGSPSFNKMTISGGTVAVDSGTVTVSQTLTLGGGTLNLGSNTLDINAPPVFTSGTINISDGTLDLQGAGAISLGGGVSINITGTGAINNSGNSFTVNGGSVSTGSGSLSCNGFTVSSGSFDAGSSNITSNGNISITAGYTQGTSTLNMTGGTALQSTTLNSFSLNSGTTVTVTGGLTASILTITNGVLTSGGTITVDDLTVAGTLNNGNNNLFVANGITVNGTINCGAGTVSVGASITGTGGLILGTGAADIDGDINISGDFTASSTTTNLGGSITVGGTFTHSSGDFIFDGTGTINQNMTFYDITVSGNLNDNGRTLTVNRKWTKTAGTETFTGTVEFINNALISEISGDTVFNILKCVASGKTLEFASGSTQTVGGTLTINGTSGNLIVLKGIAAAVWNIINPVTTVSYVAVEYSNATNTITADISRNNGNNTNWSFSRNTFAWTGAGGAGDWNDNVNWDLDFVPNSNDNITIPDTANDPVLPAGGYTAYNLTIDANGILSTAAQNLTVNNSYINNGILRVDGSETITGVDFAQGTVDYYRNSIADLHATTYNNLIISGGGTLSVTAVILAANLSITSGTLNLAALGMTVTGDLTLSSGTLNGTNATIEVGGNWNNTGATFTSTGSSVSFNNTGTIQSVNGQAFNDVDISSGTRTLGVAIVVNGNMSISGGSLDVSASNYQITVRGNWNRSAGAFVPRTGTVVFNNTGIIQNNEIFYTINISGGTRTLGSGITVTRDLLISNAAATFQPGANTVTVTRNWNRSAGTFNSVGSTVVFNGNGSILNSETFNNVQVTVNTRTIGGATVTIAGVLTQSANITVNANTLILQSPPVLTNGTITITTGTLNTTAAGNITLSSSTISLTGAGSVNSTGNSFTVNGGTLTMNSGSLSCSDFNCTLGTVNAANGTFNISGNALINGGTFNVGGGISTLIMTGDDTSINSSQNIDNLTIQGNTVSISVSNLTVNNNIIVQTGGFNQNGRNLTVAGDFTINNGASFTKGGTLTFNGTTQFRDNNAVKEDIGVVVINGTGVTLFTAMTLTNLSITAGSITLATFELRVLGNLIIMGTGTFSNAGGTLRFYGGIPQTLTPRTQDFGTVVVDNGSSVTMSGTATVSSFTINPGAGLWLDGTAGICTLQIASGQTLANNGSFTVHNSANAVTLRSVSGIANFTGNDIDYNSKKIYLNGINYSPVVNLGNSETIELSGANCSFSGITIGAGGTFIDGGQIFTVSGDWDNTNGTYTATGTAVFNGAGAQNLTAGGTAAGKRFNNITLSGAGSVTLQTQMQINALFTISNGTFNGNSNSIIAGGGWNHTAGTFTPGAGQIVRFIGTGTITGETGFINLIIRSSGTVTIAGTVNANYIALYNGTIGFNAGATLQSSGDFLALGANNIDTLTIDGWSLLDGVDDPYPAAVFPRAYSGVFNAGASGMTLAVGGNFYVNGCSMTGTANWTLNNQADDNQTIRSRAYGAITVSRSQAANFVSAVEGTPVNGGGNNTNWDFTRPSINTAVSLLGSQANPYVIRVRFSENVNAQNIGTPEITVGGVTYTLSDMYRDQEATVLLNSSTANFLDLYLYRADTQWNTNATGTTNGGAAGGTDRTGVQRALTLSMSFGKGTFRDTAKNNIAAAAGYSGVTDQMPPVLLYAVKQTTTVASNIFNELVLTFSEPILSASYGAASTFYNSADNDLTAGIGAAIVSGGVISGFGSAETGNIVTAFNAANTASRNANRTVFTLRMGGNTAVGGAIRGDIDLSGLFTSDPDIDDLAGNGIDTVIARAISGPAWYITPPEFVEIRTNEVAGSVNGWIDMLSIDFDRTVQVYDNEPDFGNGTIVWNTVNYEARLYDHSTNVIQNGFLLYLDENTIDSPQGDTDSTPTVTYSNTDSFRFISNLGRMEMVNSHNLLALDKTSPVITFVEVDRDDPPGFDESPYYDPITNTYLTDVAYNFNPYNPSTTPYLVTDTPPYTYHNVLRLVFSEDIDIASLLINLNDKSTQYDFTGGARSTASLGNTTLSGGAIDVMGLGRIDNCNVVVDADNNFLQFADERTLNIHIVGWHDGSKYPGTIRSGTVVPTGVFSTSVAHLNPLFVSKTLSEPLRERNDGAGDNITINVVRQWDIYPPRFRMHPKDPADPSDPTASLNHGLTVGKPLIYRLEFVMTEPVRDPVSDDMSGIFTLRFDSSTGSFASNLVYDTGVLRLGDFANLHTLTPPFTDSDIDDQAFTVQFDTFAGKNENTRVWWTFANSEANPITDLRGNRLSDITDGRLSLENAPPYISDTRAVVGSDLVYVEFNENVYNSSGDLAPINQNNFVLSNAGYSIVSVNSYGNTNSRKRFLIRLSAPLEIDDFFGDLIGINPSDILLDNLATEFQTAKQYPISFYGINVFNGVYLEDFVHQGRNWRINDLLGSGAVTPESMRLFASLDVPSMTSSTPFVYYDILPQSSAFNWNPQNNRDARVSRGIGLGSGKWQFYISGENMERSEGKYISMIPSVGGLFCYQSVYPIDHPSFDPYLMRPYLAKLRNIEEQTGGVTILNNVINPLRGEITKLIYDLESHGPVSIVVYDLAGNVVKPLVLEAQSVGRHIIQWDGRNNNGRIVARGVYFIRVRAPGIPHQIRKVLVVK